MALLVIISTFSKEKKVQLARKLSLEEKQVL
jgi:hypothetical protein